MSRKYLQNQKRAQRNEKNPKNQERIAIKKWLDEVNKQKFEFDELDAISSGDDEKFEERADLKELQKPLKKLLTHYPDSKIKTSIKIECEWGKCDFETNDESLYIDHVHSHFNHIHPAQGVSNVPLKCFWDLCPFECTDIQLFIRHLDYHCYHSMRKSFGFGLRTVLTLPVCQKHDSKQRNKIPDEINSYFCYWDGCRTKFNKFHEYILHVGEHISNDEERQRYPGKQVKDIKMKCLWASCDKEIDNIYELRRHIKCLHTNEKMIACPNCGNMFKNKTLFVDHYLRQTVSQRNFTCRDCMKDFPTDKLLKEHARIHINKFQCDICGMSCQKESVLARHIRYRHSEAKPFTCNHEDCSYSAKTSSDLKSHMKKHNADKVFKCEVHTCKYSSRTLEPYKRHYAKVHLHEPPTYACHECDKKYMRGNLLSRHLIAKHTYSLPPGHSRFLYTLCDDGYQRLQTKRRENLKEPAVVVKKETTTEDDIDMDVSYEVANMTQQEDQISFAVRKVAVKKKKPKPEPVPLPTVKTKDISEFAVVKTYNKKLQ